MNYIIFDLEWNQPADGVLDAAAALPGEIVQIGAVKLGSRFEATDELRLYIKPRLYPKLHKRIASLTGIRDQDLQEKGISFPQAYAQFVDWCGEDCVWMTWSTSDLPILLDNMIMYGMDISELPDYCDVQRIFSREIMRSNTRYSLDTALAILKEKGETAHDALHDARNTAKVCSHLELDSYIGEYTGKVFGLLPKGKHYASHRELLCDGDLTVFACPWCGGEVKCEPWIHFGHSTHIAYGICPEEDEFLVELFPVFHHRGDFTAKQIVFALTDDLWDIYLDKKETAQGIMP